MKKITKIESIANWQINKKLRVAAYCRVSTDSEDQLVSLEPKSRILCTQILKLI